MTFSYLSVSQDHPLTARYIYDVRCSVPSRYRNISDVCITFRNDEERGSLRGQDRKWRALSETETVIENKNYKRKEEEVYEYMIVNGESEAEMDARRRRRAYRWSGKARHRKVEEHSQRSPICPFPHFSFQHRSQGT